MVMSKTSVVVGAEAQLSRKWLDSCLATGSNEEILPFFPLPLCAIFVSLNKIVISVCKSSHLAALFSLSCRRGE